MQRSTGVTAELRIDIGDLTSHKQNVIGKSSKHFEKNLRKDERRNQLLQLRRKKREQVFAQNRNLGGFSSSPVLIWVIPLQSDVDIVN
ncbi:pre-rRNA-processing protein TSR1 homolog [Temnothorax nylanderi]|uniref:pre-rRNA-processing protein TSR1 homolog n=1 Tax=Temnothorax nylanderi TaxID=102681 RepID=UPI003A84FB9C